MIRFNVQGEYLELPADFNVQFSQSNVLFMFDKIECERSVSFDIPATPQNDRIFTLARWTQSAGTGMRRRYAAQMQGSMVTKDGYLYVSDYSKGKYKAIFVTGQLLGLQAIKNAGKIADFMTFDETVRVTNSVGQMVSPSAAASQIWANVNYRKGATIPCYTPSISLDLLYSRILAQLGVTGAALPTGATGVRILPPKNNGVNKVMTFAQRITDANQPDPNFPTDPFNSAEVDDRYFDTEDADYAVQRIGQTQWYIMRQFKAKTALKLTFPDDWDANFYLVDFTTTDSTGTLTFLGDRYFTNAINQSPIAHGDPLAGRTIDIPEGTTFLICSSDEYEYVGGSGIPVTHGFNFGIDDKFELDFDITVKSADDDVQHGGIVALQDNLPDVTFTDLLKTIAALSGKSLYYDDVNGITYDDLDFATWDVLEINDRVIDANNVSRKFSDYAQRNVINFESDDAVPSAERLVRTYTIDNDNLSEQKELQKVPFSEAQDLDGALYIQKEPEQFTVGIGYATGAYLQRVSLPLNAGIKTLCDESTSKTVQVRMTLFEYERITPKTLIYFDGVLYVWTELQYNKDIVTAKLAKCAL